jgi:hypothetical protein
MRRHGIAALMLAATLPAFFPGCDLLNNKPEIDLEQAMDAAGALANAPYVPLLIDAGGLIGNVSGASGALAGTNYISNCYATGTVRAVQTGSHASEIGGLAGRLMFVELKESWASGSVDVGVAPGGAGNYIRAGGLAGLANAAIVDCYADDDSITYAGGFRAAWRIGAREWRSAGEERQLYPMGESWAVYPSVTVPEAGDRLPDLPDETEIVRRFTEAAKKVGE